jgi:hypothetical protein
MALRREGASGSFLTPRLFKEKDIGSRSDICNAAGLTSGDGGSGVDPAPVLPAAFRGCIKSADEEDMSFTV